MKKLSLKLTGIKEALKKEEMKQVKGGGLNDCFDECNGGSCWGGGSCQASSCTHNGGQPYLVCG
jgi:hypothetical protein